jgi:hypothetical protein
MKDENVLFLLKEETIHIALIPLSKLNGFDIHSINGCYLTDDNLDNKIKDQIVTLFQRCGLVPILGYEKITTDLKEYLYPTPPFIVNDVCSISLN